MKTVKVIFENGNSFTTRINGTMEEIKEYYAIGTPFNIGSVEDDIQKVAILEFICCNKEVPCCGCSEMENCTLEKR